MMAVATMLCICKHNDNDDSDDGNGDDNLLQGGEQSSSVRDRAGAGQGWILHNDCLDLKLKYMKRLWSFCSRFSKLISFQTLCPSLLSNFISP